MTEPHATAAGQAVVLRLEGVSKVYSGTVAVKHADFEVRSGAVNVLVGENGAGKSTLVKMIAGVEQPTAGRILLDGEPVRFDREVEVVFRPVAFRALAPRESPSLVPASSPSVFLPAGRASPTAFGA